MPDDTILIVEDETIVAEDLARRLRRFGYTVVGTAELGEEALHLTQELRPRLVLMDIRLAGTMDGVEAAKRIRQECGVPVIYITASSDRATVERAKVTEPYGFILKPFEDRELESHIEIALYKHDAERKLRESREDLNRAQAVAHTGSWRLDVQKNELLWSDENWRIFGVPKGTLLTYETFLSTVHPEDREHVNEKWSAALRGEPYDIEHRIVVGDAIKWVRERAELEFDKDGTLRGGFGTTQDVTDLRKVQQALRVAYERTEWLARFPEEDPEPVLRVSLDGGVLYRNPAAAERPGWACEVGQPVPVTLRPLIERAAAQRQGLQDDVEMGGGFYAVAVALFPEERYANLYGRDITERKRAEEAVRASEERYRTLFSTMTEGFALHEITCDSEGKPCDYRFLDINPAFERLTGLKRDNVVGKTARQIMPETEPIWIERYGRVALTGEPDHFVHADAELGRHYEVTAHRTSPGRFAVIFNDITEFRAMQQREKEDAIRLAWGQSAIDTINAMHEGVALLELDGTITSINPAVERLTGLAGGAVVGRNLEALLPELLAGADIGTAMRGLALLRRGENPALPPLRLMRPDGKAVHILPSVALMDAPEGRRVAVLTLKDVTELHETSHRLRELAEQLATTEEEDRWRISRYIHDTIIQNLSLSSIRLGSLKQPLTDAKLKEESDKLGQVRQLLDQAIDECRMVMSDLTPALLYELGLIPALNDFAQQVKAKHGTRMIVEDDGQERPMSNPLRGLLFESVRELVMNALKYAGPCEIRVTVSRREDDLVICVSDSGKGFDSASAAKHSDRKGGFGLFNIRQRVDGLGGRFGIESAHGKGTTATIKVPMSSEDKEG